MWWTDTFPLQPKRSLIFIQSNTDWGMCVVDRHIAVTANGGLHDGKGNGWKGLILKKDSFVWVLAGK